MIVQFFKSGTSKSSGPRNYLLGPKTSDGRVRDPKPEVFMGDVDATSKGIDNNRRERKYSSGVLAFRKDEVPTDEQQKEICMDFLKAMAPGLKPMSDYNFYMVRHKHEGNIEIHFIIERREKNTDKSFNICPPGRKTEQFIQDFSALINHKYGFDQVIKDPFKDGAETDKFFKLDKNASFKRNTDLLVSFLEGQVKKGKYKDRDHIIKTLESKGFECTRKGNDYVSLKFPKYFGYEKAVRLKNPIFRADADYKKLLENSITPPQRTLSQESFESIHERFKSVMEEKREFNEKQFSTKVSKHQYSYRPAARAKSYVPRAGKIETSFLKHRSAKFLKFSKFGKSLGLVAKEPPLTFQFVSSKPVDDGGGNIGGGSVGGQTVHQVDKEKVSDLSSSTNSNSAKQGSPETSGPTHLSGGIVALGNSIAEIDGQILSLVQQATYAKDPQQKAMLMSKAVSLRIERERLEAKLADEKKGAMSGQKPKPKCALIFV